MNYKEFREQKQAEFDALPIFWAFSNSQFKEEMEKRGLKEKDTDKIYRFGNGGFYLKSDAEKIHEYLTKPDPLRELMENEPGFAEDAFYYEMANHEYHINWQGAWDVCNCFGTCKYGEDKSGADYLKEMGYSDKVVGYYAVARNRFMKDAREKEWY